MTDQNVENRILKGKFETGLSAEDIALMNEYYKGFDYQGAGYTFLASHLWRNDYNLYWEVIGDYLCLAFVGVFDGETVGSMAMPMTRTGTYDPDKLRQTILEVKRRYDERSIPFMIRNIPGHMVPIVEEALGGMVEFEHDRDMDEYVYEKERLIKLNGRALHKKKNHLNYFLKTYEYEACPITREMLPELVSLAERVRARKDRSEEELRSLDIEKNAIDEIMHYLDEPYIYTMAVYIDGVLEAYALGERLSPDTAVEHFEKANTEFRGLYQVICREFCRSLPEEIVYINREEDMGLPNLRYAKEALKPHHLAEKYHAYFVGK